MTRRSSHEQAQANKRKQTQALPPGAYTIQAHSVVDGADGFLRMNYRVRGEQRLRQLVLGRSR